MQAQKYLVFSITKLKKAVLNKLKVQFLQQFWMRIFLKFTFEVNGWMLQLLYCNIVNALFSHFEYYINVWSCFNFLFFVSWRLVWYFDNPFREYKGLKEKFALFDGGMSQSVTFRLLLPSPSPTSSPLIKLNVSCSSYLQRWQRTAPEFGFKASPQEPLGGITAATSISFLKSEVFGRPLA